MQRTPRASSPRRPLRRTFSAALVLLLATTGLALVGVSASAAEPPPPTIRLEIGQGGPQVRSDAWNNGDTSVTVEAGGATVVADVSGGGFVVPLASAPATDSLVRVTGSPSGQLKDIVVPPLAITEFDVPGGLVLGNGGPAPWTDVQVNLGNQWTGPTPPTTASVDTRTGAWTAEVGVAAFDLRSGFLGTTASQTDADGDMVRYGAPVPNPVVDVWDSHGVALHGWTPGSTVTITLESPGTGSFSWDVTVDQDGEYWDVPPQAPWDIVLPGWIASATGPVDMRESGTITKTIVVPAPFPFPEMDGVMVSDTVLGTLSATTIGPGGIVNVSPTCPDLTVPNRQVETDPGTGYFEVWIDQPPEPNRGFGQCSQPPVGVGYKLSDLDGDQFGANWQVDPQPSVTADSPLWDGQQFRVEGTGFDLMMVQLQQCELLGDVTGRCDPSTETLVNPYPATQGSDWPLYGARFEEDTYTAKRYLEFGNGAGIDCAAEPESCAVLVTEPQREGVDAFAPLTYYRPVDLTLTASTKGTVSTVTGTATVKGTITASEPAWVHLSGELRQRLGRTRVVVGSFDTWVYVEQADQPTPWEVPVAPYTGQAFGSGFAELTVNADLGDEGPSWGSTTQIVKLSSTKVPRR